MIVFNANIDWKDAEGNDISVDFHIERQKFSCELKDLPQVMSKMKENYPNGYLTLKFYDWQYTDFSFEGIQDETPISCQVIYGYATNANDIKFNGSSQFYLIKAKDFHDFFKHKSKCFHNYSIIFKPTIEEKYCKVVEKCTDI